MAWYHKKPKETADFLELSQTYNEKYGAYDYARDSRALDATFEKEFVIAVGDLKGKSVIVCGANAGYEIILLAKLYPTARFTAVDIADAALRKIPKNLRVNIVHANMEQLPFGARSFDVYINCRAIQSSNVDLNRALTEAVRIAAGKIVISIPNGYFSKGKLVHGLYNYRARKIDAAEPSHLVHEIKKFLKKNRSAVVVRHSEAEIFVVGG